MLIPPPKSCDTFVYVGAPILHKPSKKLLTGTGTLFGKNSDRPSEERHEVIRVRPRSYESTMSQKEVVQCTYINVPRDKKTLDCVLSRPCWMWGCEMGANECGVVGGNEAVHTLLANELDTRDENGALEKRLLGMDILRLALERGTSAKHAVEVCIHFIETYGQGGPCCNEDMEWTYENSFLFADQTEAYVLETAGIKHWAWERIPPGDFRNISNGISIRDNWGAISKDIQSICKENGWWDGETKFDWKRALAAGGRAHSNLEAVGREAAGLAHLQALRDKSNSMLSAESPNLTPRWWVERMCDVLRDDDSGICFRDVLGGFCSTGSQISWLPSIAMGSVPVSESNVNFPVHFFTGAPDPLCGTPYKPFTFSDILQTASDEENDVEYDHNTQFLWDIWRERALDEAKKRRDLVSNQEKRALKEMEIAAMSILEPCEENFSPTSSSTFAAFVQEEIDLIQDKF
mmetsp:Transcript_17264/g.34948  ORF Transcript_17264/g.34948 Transcript_17264/m.34948 type:complete len:462 (-) Transcript_17264:16-1401(-)